MINNKSRQTSEDSNSTISNVFGTIELSGFNPADLYDEKFRIKRDRN
jgi:hypothetical protein